MYSYQKHLQLGKTLVLYLPVVNQFELFVNRCSSEKKTLLPNAVPSVFFWSPVDTPAAVARRLRAKQRTQAATGIVQAATNPDGVLNEIQLCDVTEEAFPESTHLDMCVIVEEVVGGSGTHSSVATNTDCTTSVGNGTQTDTTYINEAAPAFLSFQSLKGDLQLLHYYTGLETAGKLMTVFTSLGPAVHSLNYYRKTVVDNILPIDQFILMLARLRQNMDYLPLSKLCGVSIYSAQNIFITWLNFCSRQWSEVNVWPHKDLVHFYAPADFMAKFPMTRVIVDGTEIPVQQPSNPVSQRATFSSYKNRNTVKVLVGSTPGGLVSYVSPAYGGAVSDRQIVERSNLPAMCDPQDSVMADKGFNVQDLFAAHDVTVNIPTFFKKKNRMSGHQVLADRKISSKRVHIERIIGSMKTYKILTSPLSSSETKLFSHVINVCAMLCNFRKRIVSETA